MGFIPPVECVFVSVIFFLECAPFLLLVDFRLRFVLAAKEVQIVCKTQVHTFLNTSTHIFKRKYTHLKRKYLYGGDRRFRQILQSAV